MATISRLSVSLKAKTTGLKRGFKQASSVLKRFKKQVFSLKGALAGALSVGALTALGASSVKAFEQQEQAVAALNASILSMKRNTKGLSTELQRLASQIQREGILGDEAIIQGQSFLTTYGGITDELLPRTTRIMADLAAKMGGSTVRAANLLGKASLGLVGSLAIAGISLSKAAKESKDFGLILTEIEQQVGGMNKALGATATGGIKQFKNALGDVQEKLGEVIAIAFSPWLRKISQDLGSVSFDAKAMGNSLRKSILNAAKAMAPLLDALAGLNLVWKTLKLAAAGFGLFLTMVVQGWVNLIQAVGSAFGFDLISVDKLQMIDDAFKRQLATVENLKKEIADFTTELGNATPSVTFVAKIDTFEFETQVAKLKQQIGFVEGGIFSPTSADPKGVIHQLDVGNAANASFSELFGRPEDFKNPQIDDTNELLDRINSTLQRQPAAVAG